MDRIDAMKIFVAALDHGSLAKAGRSLGRSPAAVSRAITFLEASVGAELLHRTTRSIRTSHVGERYALICRRILTELEESRARSGRRTFGAARHPYAHCGGMLRRVDPAADPRCLPGRPPGSVSATAFDR